MAKYELKTKKNDASPAKFVNAVKDDERRKDGKALLKIFKEITGKTPKMWGSSIVGYDTYHYTYKSGQEGDWMMTGFSPRKQNLSLYIMPGFGDYKDLLKKLGPHKTGVGCLYIKRLEDIHLPTLKKLIKKGYTDMKKMYKKT